MNREANTKTRDPSARKDHRLEISVVGLSRAGEAASLAKRFERLPGVLEVLINPLTERVVVRFDPVLTDVQEFFRLLERLGVDAGDRIVRRHAPAPGCVCRGCGEQLKQRLAHIEGVEAVILNADEKSVTLEYVPSRADPEVLNRALTVDPGPCGRGLSMVFDRRSARRRIGLLALLVLIYAVCYPTIKTGLAYSPPLRFAGLRAVIASGTLFASLVILRRPLLPSARMWPWIVCLAATGTFLAYGAMFLSPGVTGAGLSSVLGNTGPLLTIVLAAIFLGEPVTRAKVGALVLGTLGVGAIVWPALTDPARNGVAAAVLPLTAAAGFAAASVLFKRMEAGKSLVAIVAWQMLLGGLPLLAVSVWLEPEAHIVWQSPFPALLLFLGVVGSALALWMWYWLVQRDEVGRISLLLFAVPLLGLLLAVMFFDESVGPIEIGGIVATLCATLITVREIIRQGGRRQA